MLVRMRYVVKKPNRNGTDRWYWQRPGFPTRRLPEEEAERAQAAYALNVRADAEKRALPIAPEVGTIAWAIDKYRESDQFTRLSYSTRRAYQRWMLALADTVGDQPLAGLDRRTIKETLDGINSRGGRRHCAAVLRAVAEVGVDYGHLPDNPVTRLRLAGARPRDAIWTPDDQAAFLEASKGELHGGAVALAFAIMLNTAQRPGDVRRMQWTQYDGTTIRLRQQKTGQLVEVPVHRDLRVALDDAKRHATGTNIVARPDGRPFSDASWRKHFNRIRAKAGLSHLQARDLRRTGAVRLSEAGCIPQEVAAVTGHSIDRTERILEVYIPRSRAMARSAIAKLERKR